MSSLKENKMGVLPMGRLLLGMALPMALSMLVQAFYNVVDSVFVSRISDANNYAFTAVSLAFPVQNIMIGIATGVAVGVNALLSRALGEKNQEEVNSSALNGLVLSACGMLLCVLFGIFGAEPYMRSLTPQPETVAYGVDYIRVICIASFGIFGEVLFERLLQSTGRTTYTMITQGTGAIINIILDPILIFGYFGLPRMEVTGAAVATVIGQIVAFFLAVLLNKKKNTDVHLCLKGFRPSGKMIGRILGIGVPSMLMIAIGSLMTYSFNLVLDRFNDPLTQSMLGETGKTVFGAYFKLQSFIFMPVFGLNNGMIPIVAYNYGSRNKHRIIQTAKFSVAIAVTIMMIGLVLFQTCPRFFLFTLFDASDQMLAIGVPALRIISLSFLFAGYNIIVGSVFQALGNGVYSLIVSLARQLFAILPIAYIFAILFGLHAVWWAIPIAEIVSLITSTILLKRIYRLKIAPL
mgnify:CR=1 FL=1